MYEYYNYIQNRLIEFLLNPEIENLILFVLPILTALYIFLIFRLAISRGKKRKSTTYAETQNQKSPMRLGENNPYSPKEYLTHTYSEKVLFKLLKKYLSHNEFIICPQVAYSALHKKDGIRKKKYKYLFNSRFVDFVICDQDFKILCAIELDGSFHGETTELKDHNASVFFETLKNRSKSNFNFFRVKHNSVNDFELKHNSEFSKKFKNILEHLLVYQCDNCNAKMLIKHSSRDGSLFWGCSSYNQTGCNHTKDVIIYNGKITETKK